MTEADTRERILDVTAALVERFTMPKLTMEDVARGAGATRQTVYKLFGGKTDLLIALYVREIEAHRRPQLEQMLDADPTPDQLVATFLDQLDLARRYAFHDPALDATAAPKTADMLFRSEVVTAAWERLWRPLLERYAAAGVLRGDVDVPSAARWIMYHQYFLIAHPEVLTGLSPAPDALTQLTRQFVFGGLLVED